MEERRRFVRLDTQLKVKYTVLPQTAAKPTVTKDVGGGGVCFFADEMLQPGTTLQVEMTLPGRDTPAPFTAEVIWCEQYEVIGKTKRERAIEVGVRFAEVAPVDQQAIMSHVILNLQPPRTSVKPSAS